MAKASKSAKTNTAAAGSAAKSKGVTDAQVDASLKSKLNANTEGSSKSENVTHSAGMDVETVKEKAGKEEAPVDNVQQVIRDAERKKLEGNG